MTRQEQCGIDTPLSEDPDQRDIEQVEATVTTNLNQLDCSLNYGKIYDSDSVIGKDTLVILLILLSDWGNSSTTEELVSSIRAVDSATADRCSF